MEKPTRTALEAAPLAPAIPWNLVEPTQAEELAIESWSYAKRLKEEGLWVVALGFVKVRSVSCLPAWDYRAICCCTSGAALNTRRVLSPRNAISTASRVSFPSTSAARRPPTKTVMRYSPGGSFQNA